MFMNTKRIIIGANRLATKNSYLLKNIDEGRQLKGVPIFSVSNAATSKQFHLNAPLNAVYVAAAPLPIPNNIDATETTRFSPQRSRDISATVILSNQSQISNPIDITVDNTTIGSSTFSQDPHVQSYDCFGAISLNSVMQSNVPTPFGGMHKFTHLNMPGGQWSQEGKFISQNLQSSHYTALRDSARSSWVAYDPNATVQKLEIRRIKRKDLLQPTMTTPYEGIRSYATKVENAKNIEIKTDDHVDAKTLPKIEEKLSKKEQLKRAFKDYGATIIIFHVGISLVSLGGFYLLVSGGIDMMPILESLGLASSALSKKIAAGASTFVVAYAIHKVFAPVRISITLGATPFIVRYLRSKGFLKVKSEIKK